MSTETKVWMMILAMKPFLVLIFVLVYLANLSPRLLLLIPIGYLAIAGIAIAWGAYRPAIVVVLALALLAFMSLLPGPMHGWIPRMTEKIFG